MPCDHQPAASAADLLRWSQEELGRPSRLQRRVQDPTAHGLCPFDLAHGQLMCGCACVLQDAMASMSRKQGGGAGNVGKLNNVLMQMRKVCNHPDLITGAFDGSTTYPSRQVGCPMSLHMGLCFGRRPFSSPMSSRVPAMASPFATSCKQCLAWCS